MDNDINNSANQENGDTVTFSQTQLNYGVAVSVPAARAETTAAGGMTFAEQLRYFSCEYIHGLLFVALSIIFALAIPVVITRPERVKAMIGKFFKRGLDIIGASIGILLSFPIFIIVAAMVKFDSRGSVFYTQIRVGKNRRKRNRRYHQRSEVEEYRSRERRRDNVMGRPFKVIKFRTMVNDAEKKSGPVWATKDDQRITKVGKFLRKTRLDEFPQFINVLRGDMSLVGPRPERPNFVADLSTKVDNYSSRLGVKPGLTGLAQVETGYDADLDSVTRKVDLDLEYINNWSFWTDLKILMRTVIVVLTGRGAC
ncbi:MAG: sugar transferase [candidate division Zixibacteria bacterium]|nr:sugar transferase [candidate division Zixibacteria bacterium]